MDTAREFINTILISIHTTAKVVTSLSASIRCRQNDFNPHHREGGDHFLSMYCSSNLYFNPHHREGGDPVIFRSDWIGRNFNPHHREGGDHPLGLIEFLYPISIHTTAKVVTNPFRIYKDPEDYFNPHHREGGDKEYETRITFIPYFNPHHREGGD